MLRTGHTRKATFLKSYAVVFVCLTTKAVHLDLCSSLSTVDFLATLDRFIARRGCPAEIYSDNGTNFHGARAPHFGGIWEAAVRAMKTQLRKNLKAYALRWDELYTILTEAEAILNSRPLAPIHTDDATEDAYLTAGHFLIGRPLKAPPRKFPSTGSPSHLRRWNLVSRLKNDLWRRWTSTYLSSCAQRSKWNQPGRRLSPGDLVFVKDESLKTSHPLPIPIHHANHIHL